MVRGIVSIGSCSPVVIDLACCCRVGRTHAARSGYCTYRTTREAGSMRHDEWTAGRLAGWPVGREDMIWAPGSVDRPYESAISAARSGVPDQDLD